MLLIFMHLDELDHGHLSSIATTGTHLEDTGVAAVASLVLGGDFVEQFLYNRVSVALGAGLVLALRLLSFLAAGMS